MEIPDFWPHDVVPYCHGGATKNEWDTKEVRESAVQKEPVKDTEKGQGSDKAGPLGEEVK